MWVPGIEFRSSGLVQVSLPDEPSKQPTEEHMVTSLQHIKFILIVTMFLLGLLSFKKENVIALHGHAIEI